jgi:hypothetical protein
MEPTLHPWRTGSRLCAGEPARRAAGAPIPPAPTQAARAASECLGVSPWSLRSRHVRNPCPAAERAPS